MKQKLRVFLTLLLCAVASVGWGQTSVTIWEEDWSSGKKNDLVSSISNPTAVYSTGGTSTGSYATIYEESLAGGTSPELLIPKSSNKQTFISTINLNGVNGDLTLTFKSNKNITITSSTQNVTITKISGTTTTKAWEYTISVPAGTETLVLTFAMTTDSNARIDDIKLVGTKSGNTPSLSVSPASIAFGEKAINTSNEETFTIYFANLTQDLTVNVGSGLIGVSVSSTTISKEATSPQTVTVTYAPTTVGIISGNITVSNTDDEVSQTIEVSGSSYDASNVAYYEKVNSSLSDWSGDYIFTGINSSKYYALTGVDNNLGTTAEVSVTENGIISNSTTNAYKVTIAPTTNGYSLYMEGVGYLSYSSTGNYLNSSSTFTESNCEWAISFVNGLATITNVANEARKLQFNYNNGNSRFACYTSDQVKLTLFKLDDGTPSISADDVEIEYDATDGSIAYTIDNPVPGTSLSASTTATWLNLGEVGESSIPFTCSANETTEPRTAIVTLTYGEVTEDVTVTQAAAPVTYTTIPAIFDAATAAGSTGTNVNVTFGDWVVSGVSGSNVYVTDNNGNGFIIYKSDHGFTVNNKLSGTVFETPLKLYNGSAEFTNLTNSTTGLEVANDGSITVITDKTIADLGGVNTGAVITLSNLTYDGTVLSDGTNTIKPYNSLYSEMSFTSGKTYNVTGVYLNYGSTKEILPRNADDIVEVETPIQTTITAGTLNHVEITRLYDRNMEDITLGENVAEGTEVFFTLFVDDGYTLENVKVLNADNEEIALTENQGSWSFTMPNSSVTINATATSSTPATGDKYVKVTSTNDITDGQYLIVYEDGSVAFNGGLEKLDAVSNTIGVTIANNEIEANETTAAAEFTIDVTAGTLKSASGNYIGQTSDANGMVTSTSEAYANTITIGNDGNVNIVSEGAYLRYNSASNQTRFRYYKSASYTAQKAIQLYKKVENTPQIVKVTIAAAATDGTVNYGTLYYDNMNLSVPEGVKAYTASVSNGKIILSEVQGAIPARTGVLLKTESKLTVNTNFNFTEAAEPGTVSDGNMLHGTVDELGKAYAGEGNWKYYKLTTKNGSNLGFYFGVDGGAPFANGANKAYLAVPADQAPAKGFVLGEETTGINAIDNSQQAVESIYNLSGQRVQKATKGVYIVNGKKVVIR